MKVGMWITAFLTLGLATAVLAGRPCANVTTCVEGQRCDGDDCVPCDYGSFRPETSHQHDVCLQWTSRPSGPYWEVKKNGTAERDVLWGCEEGTEETRLGDERFCDLGVHTWWMKHKGVLLVTSISVVLFFVLVIGVYGVIFCLVRERLLICHGAAKDVENGRVKEKGKNARDSKYCLERDRAPGRTRGESRDFKNSLEDRAPKRIRENGSGARQYTRIPTTDETLPVSGAYDVSPNNVISRESSDQLPQDLQATFESPTNGHSTTLARGLENDPHIQYVRKLAIYLANHIDPCQYRMLFAHLRSCDRYNPFWRLSYNMDGHAGSEAPYVKTFIEWWEANIVEQQPSSLIAWLTDELKEMKINSVVSDPKFQRLCFALTESDMQESLSNNLDTNNAEIWQQSSGVISRSLILSVNDGALISTAIPRQSHSKGSHAKVRRLPSRDEGYETLLKQPVEGKELTLKKFTDKTNTVVQNMRDHDGTIELTLFQDDEYEDTYSQAETML